MEGRRLPLGALLGKRSLSRAALEVLDCNTEGTVDIGDAIVLLSL